MEEAERLCDRVILMESGKTLDISTPKELIRKYIGVEVIEVSALSDDIAKKLTARFSTWHRSYGLGSAIGLPLENSSELLNEISTLAPERFLRRPANLEDVFLSLTGAKLE